MNKAIFKNSTVLIIDDSPENLRLISSLIKNRHKTKVANSGKKGLTLAQTRPYPDLILLDIMMPDISGYEVCTILKKNPETQHIPIIFLTARSDAEDEEKGLQAGAVDYITKPISPPILCARIETHLALKASANFLENQNRFLEQEVAKRTAEIEAIQDAAIIAMTSLAETRDSETGNHIYRTQYYTLALAQHLQHHPHFSTQLTDETIQLIYKSAPLHDIGKVGIPDRVLLKPGKLTEDEFEMMKKHTTLGFRALEHAEHIIGMSVNFLAIAKEIAKSHHEHWDGSGYPEGLAGEKIPLAARLMALGDVYDALVSKRIYKPSISHEDAVKIITKGKGQHFDPDIVDAFLDLQEKFKSISEKYTDSFYDLDEKKSYLNQIHQPPIAE